MQVSFTAAPALLTVAANAATMAQGSTVPALTATTTGFVNGDTQAVVSGSPSLTTAATSSSPAGNYAISVGRGTLASANYNFQFVNGTLTVSAPAVATLSAIRLSSRPKR